MYDDESEKTVRTLPPFVEVELCYENSAAGVAPTWRALEMWTQNTIYSVDWSMKCIEVRRRDTNRLDPSSRMLGTVLVGGQKTGTKNMELTFPCPRPGYEAVFRRDSGRGFVSTSSVDRVVLRLRVLTIRLEDSVEERWHDLSGSFRLP